MAEIVNERRNYARLDVQLKVAFGRDSLLYSGVIDCLAFGGVRILSAETFPKGAILKLEFSPPHESEIFESEVIVAWVQEKKSMGVQFLNLKPEQIILLEKILTPAAGGVDRVGGWD